MKRKIIGVFTALFILSTAVFADKLVFSEFSLSYGKITGPGSLANNTAGTYDTGIFEARTGLNILKWADVYAGASFNLFIYRQDTQQHYTFFPVYGGIRGNIMPDWAVYPDVFIEYGVSISNLHGLKGADRPWNGSYYNFGAGVNWNMEDIAVLSLRIERPAVAGDGSGEFHIFKTGIAWKIFY
jgi:hypothetical protein